MSLIQMSISGAVIIFVVTVVRALAINRLPKNTFIALWGLALVRLLLPFSLPSPLSVYSLVNRPAAAQLGSAIVRVALPVAPVAAAPAAGLPVRVSPWMWIWAAGFALCTLYFAIAYIRCRRRFAASRPVANAFTFRWLAEHSLRRPVTIRESCSISAPLTYGIFRPVILMPLETDWNDDRKLQYVLAHEHVHIRRFDGATKLLLAAALCIHWFNPLAWVMYILANRDIELSCDEKVVRIFGETVKSAYALMLIDMEERKSGLAPLCNHFSKNSIEERIEAIMKIKRTTILTVVIACAVVLTVGGAFATSAAAAGVPNGFLHIREDIAIKFMPDPATYSKYSPYGVSVSDDGKMLLYNGQRIRLFIDNDSDVEAFYYDEDGTVNLSVTRSSAKEIISVEPISAKVAEEYLSAFIAEEKSTLDDPVQIYDETEVMVDAMVGEGEPKYDKYSPLGISYSAEKSALYFNGQRVRLFVDEDDGYFNVFWTDEAGTVDLAAVRNSSGQIVQIETISREKAQGYVDSLNGLEDKVAKRVRELYPED